jgi:hypothetical protein
MKTGEGKWSGYVLVLEHRHATFFNTEKHLDIQLTTSIDKYLIV